MIQNKPSKNARKREQHALQELGEYLISLKSSDLDSLDLSEDLSEAVRAAGRMKSHGALRRQKQLIGKLMRQADAAAIRSRLDTLSARERAEKNLFAKAERWRDRLINGGPDALGEFELAHAGGDEELRRLLAELSRTLDQRTEKSLQRQVFRRIRDILVRIAP